MQRIEQLAESAARSLQNALSEDFTPIQRRDLAATWRREFRCFLVDAPRDYLQLLAFCECLAGWRKAA